MTRSLKMRRRRGSRVRGMRNRHIVSQMGLAMSLSLMSLKN
jgi:hypothetical protein